MCLFTSLECLLPEWGQKEDVPPNSDQLPPGSFYAVTSSRYDVNNDPIRGKVLFRIVPYNGPEGGIQMQWRMEKGDPKIWNGAYYNIGDGSRDGYYSMGARTVRNYSECYWDTVNPCRNPDHLRQQGVMSASFIRAAGGVVVMGTRCGCMQNSTEFEWPISSLGEPQPGPLPDPERQAQGWRECTNAGMSEFVRVVGKAITYRESQAPGARAPIVFPACPASHPVPFQYGFGLTDSPLDPAVTYPRSQPMPDTTRGLEGGYPNTYPDCPTPVSCTVHRPAPETPLKPLPTPDGQPQPMPPVPPGYAPCAWGPYAMPESTCLNTNTPQPERTATPSSSDPVVTRLLGAVAWLQLSDAEATARNCRAQMAAAGTLDPEQACLNTPIFVPGVETGEAGIHDADVISAAPDWTRLVYMSGPDKEQSVKRNWYNGSGYGDQCGTARRSRGVECDEYPFYTSVEGGPAAHSRLATVLREVPKQQNTLEGIALGRMHVDPDCNMATPGRTYTYPGSGTQPFLVVPLVVRTSEGFAGPPSFHVCKLSVAQ